MLLLLTLLAGCPRSVPPLPAAFPEAERAEAESLSITVEALAHTQLNKGRQRRARHRAEDLGLDPRAEWIDWWTWQGNLVMELPGQRPEVVYLVAHYDKTDSSWLAVASMLVNGALDPVVGLTTTSRGAVDNASGVAVALQVASELAARPERTYTWRVLLTGAEEVGLRGSRAHMAGLGREERDRILLAINIDSVGSRWSEDCLMTGISEPQVEEWALDRLSAEGLPLGESEIPSFATSDHAPFARTGPLRDVGRGVAFSLVGGLLPQRSWFTTRHQAPVLYLGACEIFDVGDVVGGTLGIPVGRIHGFRDHPGQLDPERLHRAYEAALVLAEAVEEGGLPVEPES